MAYGLRLRLGLGLGLRLRLRLRNFDQKIFAIPSRT